MKFGIRTATTPLACFYVQLDKLVRSWGVPRYGRPIFFGYTWQPLSSESAATSGTAILAAFTGVKSGDVVNGEDVESRGLAPRWRVTVAGSLLATVAPC